MADESGWFPMKRRNLLKELQNILREYHDPVQLLHELVQNADDARATIMKITYDKQKYDPGGTFGKYLKSPALCVYNDGVFDDGDWDGVTSVCLSHKEDKVDKIGRYGQGFKSVFHLTDYPIIVSGEWMLLIDPFKENKECKQLKLIDEVGNIKVSRMFRTFGLTEDCIRDGFYPGTLFWFSLRLKANDMSSNEWPEGKMNQLIKLFKEDASLVLLFLKYLKRIELYEFECYKNPYLSIEMNFESDDQTRNELKTLWSNIGKQHAGKNDIVANAEICLTSCKQQEKQAWTISHYLANAQGLKGRLATLATDKEIACLPYVGIAYQKDKTTEPEGRIFSFLPLPSSSTTSLPVHVNGNFTLSQNRRHIKLSDGRLDDKFVEWNENLVEQLLSKAYISVVQHLIKQTITYGNTKDMVQKVYGCFPQEAKYDNIWKKLVDTFYREVLEMPVFYSDLRNGTWVSKHEAVLFGACASQLYALEPSQQSKIEKTVKFILLKLNKAVVEGCRSMRYLVKHGMLNNINSKEVIALLKKSPDVYDILDSNMKIELLQYIMLGDHGEFSGLKLLPLHSQSFETFSNESSEVFICNKVDVNLFPGLEHRFVSTKLPKSVNDELVKLADSSKFQLRTLKKENISKLLIDVFKKYCQCTNGVYVEKQKKMQLDTKWITDVWGMILRFQEYPTDLKPYEEVPLIPQLRPDNTRLVKSFYILKGDYILEKTADERSLPPAIITMLTTNGVGVLKENKIIKSNKIVGIDNYIKCASMEGIMELCKRKPALKENFQSYVGFSGNLWCPRRTTAISFGQEEKLVTRLQGILYGYPEDHSVLKEILQNADDAGASEVHFVYDMRHHSTRRIFHTSWKPLQGPALCVFNDACFTTSDLEGIKHLGIGSKTEDKTKTGKFGLGFNAVYHLTDAPMIMSKGKTAASGGFFLVLDPHCQYAPIANSYESGMRMSLEELCTDYPDVYNTFLSSNELKSDEGTWFRFPLRTKDMAITSEIRKKTCDIEHLLSNIKEDIEECLLFLLNVRKIRVSVIDLKSRFRVKSQVYVSHRDSTHVRFHEYFKDYTEIMAKSTLDINSLQIKDFTYFVDLSIQTGVTSKWLIVQTLGFSKPEEIDYRLKKSMMEKQTVIIPRGGVAIRISDTDRVVRPRVFCLLPLEIETGLTCHINGQFAVDMSRNKLWGSDVENRDIRGIWNSELIRLNISYAYAECIGYLTKCVFNKGRFVISLQKYFKSIPLFSNVKGAFWQDLVFHLFLQMKLRRLCAFPIHPHLSTDINYKMGILGDDMGKNEMFWVARHDLNEMPVLFDALNTQMSLEDAKKLRSILIDMGMKISCTPSILQQSIFESCAYYHERNVLSAVYSAFIREHNPNTCVCIETISPEAAIAFFKSYESSKVDRFDKERIKSVEEVQMCLWYCLQINDWTELCDVPLLLSESGCITRLQMNNNLVLSKFYYLLPHSANVFVHRSIVGILLEYNDHFQELTKTKFVKLLPLSISSDEYKRGTFMSFAKTDEKLIEFFKGVWMFIDSTDSFIDELNEWCLLPVVWESQTFLFPLKYCQYTIDYVSFMVYPELLSILVRMNLPQPAVRSAVLSTVVATYDNRDATLNCLHKWRDRMDRTTKLEGLECLLILQYLIRDISVNQKKKICKLKELKLYTSLNYETISLTAQKILVFDNNTSMPRDGLAELFSFLEVDVIVDIYERKAFNLFQLLGCDRINSVQMYLQYILPNLKYIDEQNRILHLEFVKDFLLSDRNVAFALKSHKLFSTGQFFCKGSDFYDPENELFATACFQHEFPPSPFCDSSWRKFMIHAGMRTKLSEEVLLCFAKRAAHQDINHHQLVVAFVDFVDKTNVENSFLNAMASIPFVPLDCHEFEYEKIHQSFEPNMKFITYAGSNSHENIKLLWTSANVLPKYAMPREKLIRSKLKIVLEPDFNLVVNHLRCICYELVKTCTLHEENILTEVMTSIYDFFNKAGGNVSCIKDIPLIHVLAHKMFARVNQVVVYLSEEDEIAPFLVKAPTEYGRFFKLFHALGMNSEPTSNNYATVLKDLQEYVAKRVLSPNELNLVRKALKGFMKSLQNLDEPINKLDVDVLYLLSDDNHLKPSTELYYDSLEIPRNRLEGMSNLCFIADMSCIGFNVSELHLLFSYLPHANRPLSVSLFVKEHIQFKELHESSVASSLHDCLTSDIFILAVLRIIKHDQLSLKNDFNAKEMEIVSGRLRRLRVLAVSGLETLFADQKSMSHAKSKPCALDESNEILYLEDFHMGLDSWLQSYDVELESILRVLCHNKFQPGSILAFLTHINSPSINIHDRLTKVGKGFLEDEELSCIWHPCPGSFVPEELIPLLQKVSKQIPIKEYAVIRNQIDDAYIYVIVTGYNSFSKKYSLNIGQNEDIEISEDNLFEIKSLFSDDENTTEEQIRNDTYTFLPTDSIDGHSTLEYARTYHLSGKPNKQIGVGRKWLNQAIYDLQTGFATLKGVNKEKVKGHNWVCLQSQQAAEKAIKGARYATDANKFQLSHHLQSNIPDGDFTLEQFASSLQSIIRDVNKLRYPDIYNIPADMYSNDHAVKALDLSHKIVEYVKSEYFGHCTDLDDW